MTLPSNGVACEIYTYIYISSCSFNGYFLIDGYNFTPIPFIQSDFIRFNDPKSMSCLFRVAEQFLAPPAERQRSFSNADSSVVRRPSSVRPSSVVNFSIKSLISQKLSDNFFSFLACSFLRMVPMHSKNMDLVESS